MANNQPSHIDYDLAVELYNRIIDVASWFIVDVNVEKKTIEELKK